jgi:predicted amidohydrolase YtcJ
MNKNRAIRLLGFALALALVSSSGCAKKPEPAEFVLTNGRIVTMDAARPEAQALAATGGTIVAVGTAKEIERHIGPGTEVIDLGGLLATPGLIDAHVHFTGIGQSKLTLDLTKAKNWDDIVAMVAEAVKTARPGEFIGGRGWHQEKWDKTPEPNVNGLPYHDALSHVSPDHPVVLTHASGHSSLANAKAMEMAKITAKTASPAGGEIIKDAKGRPIGAFLERAQGLLGAARSAIAMKSAEEMEADRMKVIELADTECLSKGLTEVHDAGTSWETVERYKKAIDAGTLGVRLYVMLNSSNDTLEKNAAEYKLVGYSGNRLTVRSIKRVLDGALGPRGAWLLEPYADLPTSVGLNTYPVDDLRKTAKIAVEKGFQLNVHAIGDRANRDALDVYEEAFKAHPEVKDTRWRVEHAQHLSLQDIPRFGALGVIASMEGIHCTSDGPWVLKRLGPRRADEGAYVWRKLMETGAVIANGTDAPVEAVDPIPCFYASVTRMMNDGTEFYPGQKMTRAEALRSYTLNAAYAAFEEDIKGSLAPGKLADVTVFSKDIMTCPDDEILGAEVVYTIVGGKIAYKK